MPKHKTLKRRAQRQRAALKLSTGGQVIWSVKPYSGQPLTVEQLGLQLKALYLPEIQKMLNGHTALLSKFDTAEG